MGGAVSSGRDNAELIDNLMGGNYIRTPNVERVFRALDRGDYMTPEARDQAYKDLAWRNGPLHMSAPCIYSEVMEGLEFKPGLSFLNVGSGTGYLSTLAGLMLGSSGINHGVEIHPSVWDYANKKLTLFMDSSPTLDEFDFCEPKFYHGNGLCLAPLQTAYDRVYCGAGCPEEYHNYFQQLIKVGGILVMPLNDNLLQVKRTGAATWATRSLLNVTFAALRVPTQEEAADPLRLEEQTPARLQQLSRAAIREAMRGAMRRRHADLREPPPTAPPAKKSCPRRICIPVDDERNLLTERDMNTLHDLDRASGAHEMNALLSLVLSMGHNRVAGALRVDPVDSDSSYHTSDDEAAEEGLDYTDDEDGGLESPPLEPLPQEIADQRLSPTLRIVNVTEAVGRGGEGDEGLEAAWGRGRGREQDRARERERGGRERRSVLMFEFRDRGGGGGGGGVLRHPRRALRPRNHRHQERRFGRRDRQSGEEDDREDLGSETPDPEDDITPENEESTRERPNPADLESQEQNNQVETESKVLANENGDVTEDRAPKDDVSFEEASMTSQLNTPPSGQSDGNSKMVPPKHRPSNGRRRSEKTVRKVSENGNDPEVPAEEETCLDRTEEAGPSNMEWEAAEAKESSHEEEADRSDVSKQKEEKRQKLDSGIGEENSPSSGSGSCSGGEGSQGEGEESDDEGCGDSYRGRRRLQKRGHFSARSSSSSSVEDEIYVDEDGTYQSRRPHRPKDQDAARREKLSLFMQRAVKELPLPYAMQKYVNLNRCFEV